MTSTFFENANDAPLGIYLKILLLHLQNKILKIVK